MKKPFLASCALAAAAVATGAAAQTAPAPQTATPAPVRLPYAAVHDPQFIRAGDAAFMSDDDRVIGLMSGATAKGYPAAILSQHGLVEDRSPKGPIAVTW